MSSRRADIPLALISVAEMARARLLLKRGAPRAFQHYRLEALGHSAPPLPTPPMDESARHDVRVASRAITLPVVRSTCLPTALSLAAVLARRGLECDVVLGVSQMDGFSAHAWIEAGARRFDPSGNIAADYKVIARMRRSVRTTA
ncbi:MAG: Transglutaminase-like superfamily [Actinomycetota bacterium]|jgi:hypothetical protein|nr:Transglutaminase-like superfamily [Actinomycetota bacterium]